MAHGARRAAFIKGLTHGDLHDTARTCAKKHQVWKQAACLDGSTNLCLPSRRPTGTSKTLPGISQRRASVKTGRASRKPQAAPRSHPLGVWTYCPTLPNATASVVSSRLSTTDAKSIRELGQNELIFMKYPG